MSDNNQELKSAEPFEVKPLHASEPQEKEILTTDQLFASSRAIDAEYAGNNIYHETKTAIRKQNDVILDDLLSGKITREQANEILTALQTEARMHADTDPLTDVYNRRGFTKRIKEVVAQSHRTGSTVSMAVIDIDHFKEINDSIGHDGGDAVLQQVSGFIRANSRISDILARIGGEEFVLAMPDTSEEGAIILLEKLRSSITASVQEAVNAMGFPIGDVTISAGIVEGEAEKKLALEAEIKSLITTGDERLYVAKEGGRNQVVSSRNVEEIRTIALRKKSSEKQTVR